MRCYELATLRSRELVIPRSRATARPYGSEPYSRNWPKNKHFLFQSQFDFLHARVRVAPPPQLRKPAALQPTGDTPELPMQPPAPAQQLRCPASSQRISQAPPPCRSSCACARGNELMQRSRLATTLISEPPPSCNAALPPRRNASCCRPRACAGGPRGCESRTNL